MFILWILKHSDIINYRNLFKCLKVSERLEKGEWVFYIALVHQRIIHVNRFLLNHYIPVR